VLLDVLPDGFAKPLTWGIARGRYLASLSEPHLLEPHRVYEWQIDLWATANTFRKQHRIRVDVSSSFFPFFGRNHNTGNPTSEDTDFRTADQVIHHCHRYPSHILLPIVPD
jgi:putative CocE/NonD family hydrolase